jgi:uncharacterized protein (TIGR00730 family)
MAIAARTPVTVFCGSKQGADTVFGEDAATLGRLLATQGFDVVYGGSDKGLMGILANNALSYGASVTGIIPEVLLEWEHQHSSLTKLIISKDMHERKKTMYQMGRAGIVLPGGYGTLDEMFEMLTWNQLSIHDKKIYILNSGGFYNHLIDHLNTMHEQGFLYNPFWERIKYYNEPEQLVETLCQDLGRLA